MELILVTEAMAGAPLEQLQHRYEVMHMPELWREPAELCHHARKASALLVRNQTQVDARLLANAPHLRVIGRAGVGLDNIDMAATSAAGVVVTFSPGANANAVAELAIGCIISLSRHLVAAHRHVQHGGWSRLDYLGQEIAGRTLAVIGCGATGRRLAGKAKALGMNVLGFDPFMDASDPALAAVDLRLGALDEVVASADFVSCHVPGSRDTLKMFNAARFAQMRPGAMFINTARGNVVDETALHDALLSGHLGGAALDVRAVEPPVPGALETLPNVLLTPHIGGLTQEAQTTVLHMICQDVDAVLQGQNAVHFANFGTPQKQA